MYLLIYKVDTCESEDPVCILEDGEHIIGRGKTLGCNDKRASKTHACIKIKNGNATITSTHVNPCFFQSANSATIVILTKDVPTDLKEGDKFGIFPDSFWFKIKFQNESHLKINNCSNINGNKSTNAKECSDNHNIINIVEEQTTTNDAQTTNVIPEANTDLHSEQVTHSTENTNLESTLDTCTHNSDTSFNSNILPNEVQETISESLSTLSDNASAESSTENKSMEDEHLTNDHAKIDSSRKTDLNNIDDAKPSSSGTTANVGNDQETKPRRDRCWYSNNCYRKNSDHRKEYSHPGDSDYESDPNDTRPRCRYGKNCYRKNKDHQKKYKHSGIDLKQTQRHGTKKRNCTKKVKKDMVDDLSEDEYDFEDPFLDDSEDAYNEESWSESDSSDDCTDSSNTNEADNENTRTLMKEAKRFTKRKK